jgi:signal transduction histidine kinase
MHIAQPSAITRQKRVQALASWVWQQAKYSIAIEHTDPEIVSRGESLAALTLVIMLGLFVVLLAAIAANLSTVALAVIAILLLLVTFPTYVLARRGFIQIAVGYFIGCFSLVITLNIFTNTEPGLGRSVLLDSMMGLNLTPLLAALLIRPRTALIVALANTLLQAAMYSIWRSIRPGTYQPYDILTFLVGPICDQIVLGITCFLLASQLGAAGRQHKQRLAWFDSLLAALPVAVAVYDPEERKFVFRNEQFETLTGVVCADQRPSVARQPYELHTQGSTPPLPANEWPWESAVRSGRFGQFYSEVRYPERPPIHIQENTVSIAGMMTGRPNHIVYAAADVSQQRRLQQQVEKLLNEVRRFRDQANQQIERLKTSLLSNVSHELRTPLNSIISHADLILNGSSEPIGEITAQDVRVIFESASYLRTIVNEMLDAAKLDAGSLALETQLLDLREPIQAALATIRVLAEQKKLTLLEMVPELPVMVVGDPTRLQQIILNLLSNAVKFTSAGGLSLRLEIADEQARVTVEDTGCGVPDKERESIFEQFVQLRPDFANKPEGAGLGLSIARALAALHEGGELWLDKSEVGRGSTFVFMLPVARPSTQGASGAVPPSTSGMNGA